MTSADNHLSRSQLRAADADVSARRTVVARALAPIRRVTGLQVARAPHEIEHRTGSLAPFQPRRELHLVRWSFIVVVLLPTLVFGLYLFLVSSDQYVAETRFAVRTAEPMGGDPTAAGENKANSLDAGAGGGSYLSGGEKLGGQDAEIVANYIHSRAVIDDVARTVDVRAIFRRPEADVYARLSKSATTENLADYWKRMVSVYIEGSSGIVTLSVSAFRRDDALTLADAIVKSSEALVNSLSLKGRADAMRLAEDEVRRSDSEMRFALADLTAFRNAHHLIDPVQSSETTGKLLMQLMGDKIESEAQIYVAERAQGPDAPGMKALRAKLDSIDQHVTELREQMAGNKQVSDNLAATLAAFEGLELKKQFAERMYGFARDGVERARVQATRQMVYLTVFVPASLPQDYTYPLRFTDLLLFAVAAFMIWVCGLTITASVLDHRL